MDGAEVAPATSGNLRGSVTPPGTYIPALDIASPCSATGVAPINSHLGGVGLNPNNRPPQSTSQRSDPIRFGFHLRRRLLAAARDGAYPFRGGKGSRAGSGLSFARIALRVWMRGENGICRSRRCREALGLERRFSRLIDQGAWPRYGGAGGCREGSGLAVRP